MRIQVFQHVPFETPGYVAEWAALRGHALAAAHLYRGDAPPPPDAYDWLVVMGGPMGVYDEPTIAWLGPEKCAISAALGAGKTIFGFCLGSQLLAEALGARVYVNSAQEIGWMPVEYSAAARKHPALAHFPETAPVMHWHGDAFDLPTGAVRLASSAITPNQGFIYEDRVFAFQYHIEMTPEIIDALIAEFPNALRPTPTVQSAEEIRAATREHAAARRDDLFHMLDILAAQSGAAAQVT